MYRNYNPAMDSCREAVAATTSPDRKVAGEIGAKGQVRGAVGIAGGTFRLPKPSHASQALEFRARDVI
jgi:hypothetical protein